MRDLTAGAAAASSTRAGASRPDNPLGRRPAELARVIRILATAAAATAVLWWSDRYHITGGTRFRLALTLAAGVLLVPWTAYSGLLT